MFVPKASKKKKKKKTSSNTVSQPSTSSIQSVPSVPSVPSARKKRGNKSSFGSRRPSQMRAPPTPTPSGGLSFDIEKTKTHKSSSNPSSSSSSTASTASRRSTSSSSHASKRTRIKSEGSTQEEMNLIDLSLLEDGFTATDAFAPIQLNEKITRISISNDNVDQVKSSILSQQYSSIKSPQISTNKLPDPFFHSKTNPTNANILDGKFFICQLPSHIPYTSPSSSIDESKRGRGRPKKSPFEHMDQDDITKFWREYYNKDCQNHALMDVPPGQIGDLQFYKSGKVLLKIGNVSFDVSANFPYSCHHSIAQLDVIGPHFFNHGPSVQHLVISPNVDSLLKNHKDSIAEDK